MRGGKSIGLIALTLVGAGFIEPTWQWFVGRYLDAATRQGGISGFIERGASMMHPAQQLLFGMAAGMFIALTIGYWQQISAFTKSIPSKIAAPFVFLWNLSPNVKVLVAGSMVFSQDEMEKEIEVSPDVYDKITEIRTPNYSNVCANRDYGGKIVFRRTDRLPKKIWYEIRG